MKKWLYKWLPRFCGCHCRKERSFHWKGQQFPVCARCTGELVGMLVSLFSCFFFRVPLEVGLLLLVPMIIDGLVQLLTSYESNNRRRFITGFLFGFGIMMLAAIHTIFLYKIGFEIGVNLGK